MLDRWNDIGNKLVAMARDFSEDNSSIWTFAIEHRGEHYGQLVVYYRANNLVPRDSRRKCGNRVLEGSTLKCLTLRYCRQLFPKASSSQP
jgi:hypothetical protein